jgi:2-hydroxy-3-keto-5-methylthiopentenyl-1-phosphate phosphatase
MPQQRQGAARTSAASEHGATPVASSSGTVPAPPLLPGQPPIALLVDYDGTIATTDVADTILYHFIGEAYRVQDRAYDAGLVGSRALFEGQVKRLRSDPAEVIALADAQPHDPTFGPFARRALELGVPVEIVSDGLGFYIEPALRRMGAPAVPVITSRTTLAGHRAWMTFPNGHPDCLVCGTCKRQRVLAHQAAGRTVVFVGDGESDRYAAAYSDLIFAKRALVTLCEREGWAYTPWHDFSGLETWLDRTVEAWRSDPSSLPRHTPKPFICGPEVWGPGRKDPPAPRTR